MRLTISAAVVLGLMVTSLAYAGQSALTPTALRCEYLTNPVGIDVQQPRLTWVLDSAERGARQTAYQIRVASSEAALKAGKADLWDSGKVKSDETIQIAYGGKPLAAGQRAYWQVRVWDQDGQDSEYSAPAYWEMGLGDADWKAQWIGAAKADSAEAWEPAPYFRKTFTVSKRIKSARAYVCGLGYYELSLNGEKVGDHVLDPGYTQYNKRVLYVTYDITDRLQMGDNAVGVLLGNGFYNQWVTDVWNFHKAPWRDRPKMILQVQIEYVDGSSEVIGSDTTWKVATGPILQNSARGGEVYDARLEMTGWNRTGFDDSAWKTAVTAEAPKGAALRAQMIEPMRVMKTINPVVVMTPKPGVYVYNLGQNITGWARIKVSGPAGAKLVMRFGERLKPDGTIDMSNIDPYVDKQLFQRDIYTLKGKGVETWEPRFTYHGFQYVQVESSIPLYRESLQGCVVYTAFPKVGSFECSNPVINKLQKMTEWSYIGNFQCIPTDCPHREKNGWTGDAHLAAEAGMYNFDNAAGYTGWINSIKDAQFENGFVPDVVPDPKWTLNGGPAWESVYILLPWYMYQYNGDTRILAEHYEGMQRLMNRLGSQAKDHVLYNGLNDWVAIKPTKAEITVTSYYYVDAVVMSKIAALLGKAEDATKYAELAEQIREAYNKTLFDKATGLYRGGTQTAQLTPLYQGIANDQDKPAIFKGLMEALAKDNNHPTCGVFGAHFMPRVLTENGQIDLAFKMLTQPTGPGWGEWVAKGYTTLQENWGRGDSGNHIFFGNISAWFYNTLAGIRLDPEKPAWKHIIIKPHLAGDLTYAKASVQTIRGVVAASWVKTEKGLELKVTVPANTTATVYVPAVGQKGKIMAAVKPVKAEPEDGYVRFEVGAGTHEFHAVLQ
ncbi:MAG: family 78 glycoside hydrolase catalytic domain [Bacillota bacterium]